MSIHNARFMELTPKLGGMDPKALASFFYWNNPLALKSWTMNVVELLLLGGAALAFVHAAQALQVANDPTFLCIWVAAVVYCIAIEIPIYFPERFGGRSNSVVFMHNEFSAGLFYDRTPLYILALYPALLCLAYVFVQQAGVFDGAWGLFQGALCVAFLVTFAALWGSSLAEYRSAVDGVTKRGTPIGSLPYATACFAACLYIVFV